MTLLLGVMRIATLKKKKYDRMKDLLQTVAFGDDKEEDDGAAM